LRDQTWAQDRVYDSDLTPLAVAVMDQTARPYIVVYTDQDDIKQVTGLGELYSGEQRELSVAIEIGVASAIRDPTGKIKLQFAATDTGMEWACDVTAAQCIAALYGNTFKNASPYGELFKRLVQKVRRVPSRRGGQGSQGVRFAARRIILVCQPMWDFVPGNVPDAKHPVWDFIAEARSNPVTDEVDIAGLVEGLMETEQAPDWRLAQSLLGLATKAVQALNVPGTPLPWDTGIIETPPYDPMDPSEQDPVLTEIITDENSKDMLDELAAFPIDQWF
jgi:hypothetical protein